MKVYVLFRLFLPKDDEQKKSIKKAVERALNSLKTSALRLNGRAEVVLLLNDDSPEKEGHLEWLSCQLDNLKKDCAVESHKIETNQEGSAAALYKLKSLFVSLAGSEDIAVILDQDDTLKKSALSSIVMTFHISRADIVISDFEHSGSKKLRIDGASDHKRFLASLVNIEYADSLCWTKSYKKGAMERHLRDLRAMMGGEDELLKFYHECRAFDDFIDFAAMLYSKCKVAKNLVATHIYHKDAASITGTPKIEDFKVTRPKCLLALVNLVYSIKEPLRKDAYERLFRFLTIKMLRIERILKKYKDEFNHGNTLYGEIAALTHPNYFIHKLTRYAFEGDESMSPEEVQTTKQNFCNLLKHSNIPHVSYGDMHLSTARYICQKACMNLNAKEQRGKRKSEADREKSIFDAYVKSSESLIRKVNFMWFGIVLIGLIIGGLVALGIYKGSMDHVLTACTILFGLVTLILNNISETQRKIREEENLRQTYCSEFEDLIRHLEAGCKVLIQLRKELDADSSVRPSPIHFINLCLPRTSYLLTDNVISVTPKKYMDQISRIKVNVRNINNSGIYLQKYVTSPTYNPETMKNLIDWELARYFGYLVNFRYVLREGKFRFPDELQLDMYLEQDAVLHDLTKLFLGLPAEERLQKVSDYIDAYKKDRREERAVVLEKM